MYTYIDTNCIYCMHAHTYIYIHVHVFTYIHIYTHVHIYTYIDIYNTFHVLYTYTHPPLRPTAPQKTYVSIFHVLYSYTWVLNPSYCIAKNMCTYITCIVFIYILPEPVLLRHKKYVYINYMYCIHVHAYLSLPTA